MTQTDKAIFMKLLPERILIAGIFFGLGYLTVKLIKNK